MLKSWVDGFLFYSTTQDFYIEQVGLITWVSCQNKKGVFNYNIVIPCIDIYFLFTCQSE